MIRNQMPLDKTQPIPHFLTAAEVAEMLQVRKRTVYAWVQNETKSKIPVERFGGTLRFRLDRILKWSKGGNEDES